MVYLGAAGQIFTFIPITILSYFLDMTALLFNLISIYLVIERNIAKTAIAGTFAYFIYYQTYLITSFSFRSSTHWVPWKTSASPSHC